MQRRCAGETWADCVYAATMYWRGCGVAQDVPQAEALYRRACSFGSMLGCAMVARVGHDDDEGIAFLEEPCRRGYGTACANLGVILFNRGHEQDVPRATQLLEVACREENIGFCAGFSKIVIKWKLASRYHHAEALIDAACKAKDFESCYMLAVAFEDGSLGTTDYTRAAALNSATCGQNYLPSCNAWGYMLVLGHGCEKAPLQGAILFYNACNQGYAPACDSMGEATEKGWGGPADQTKALPFYQRGCELGSDHACRRAEELKAVK